MDGYDIISLGEYRGWVELAETTREFKINVEFNRLLDGLNVLLMGEPTESVKGTPLEELRVWVRDYRELKLRLRSMSRELKAERYKKENQGGLEQLP